MPVDRCVHIPAPPKCKPACGSKGCPWCIVTRLVARKWIHDDVVTAARAVVEGGDIGQLRDALAKLDEPKAEEPAVDPRQKGLFDE